MPASARTVTRRRERTVVLVSDDSNGLSQLVAELRALGCCVLRARNLGEVADLVRAGIAKRFVLIRIEPEIATAAELRAAMEEQLPGWRIQADEADDLLAQHRASLAVQLLN